MLLACLMLLGITGWFFVGKFGSPSGQGADTDEAPLGDAAGIVVNSQGEVFVGSMAYERIQVYSPEGRFLRGWTIPTSGVFSFALGDDGLIHVAVCRGRNHLVYDRSGNLVASRQDLVEYERWDKLAQANERGYRDAQGNVYRFGYNPLITQVIRITPKGQKATVASTPLRLWPITFPFPAILFTHGSGLILAIYFFVVYLQRRKHLRQVPEAVFRKWEALPTWIRRRYTKKMGSSGTGK